MGKRGTWEGEGEWREETTLVIEAKKCRSVSFNKTTKSFLNHHHHRPLHLPPRNANKKKTRKCQSVCLSRAIIYKCFVGYMWSRKSLILVVQRERKSKRSLRFAKINKSKTKTTRPMAGKMMVMPARHSLNNLMPKGEEETNRKTKSCGQSREPTVSDMCV